MLNHSARRTALVPLLLLAALAACSAPNLPTATGDKTPGAIHHVEALDSYKLATLRLMLWWADVPEPVTVSRGIRLYRIEYWTTDPHGEPTVASGLAAAPKKDPLRGVVSYQHGTTPNRHAAPSKPTLHEGVLGSAVFAGAGYLFLAPDYIGLGTSMEPHPYLHAETAATTTVDLLRAAKTLLEALGMACPDEVFLTGFSQGGHATMVAHRALEKMEDPPFKVAASAPVAGPYNLRHITFPAAMQGASSADSLYMAWVTEAFCRIYEEAPETVMAEPYAEQAAGLFDGEHEPEEIMAALPANPRDMFSKAFLDAFDNNKSHWFLDALQENSVLQWAPKAAVKMYYGDNDVDVPPDEAKSGAAALSQRGANAEAISVGPYTHDVSILHAVPKIRKWFDQIAAKTSE